MATADGGTEIGRADIGGIPLWHGPAAPGVRYPETAALMFRVGRADESLPWFGLTHLVEHLAMFGVGTVDFAANALVDDTRTVFYAAGEQEEVAGFLQRVCESLRSLPLERLELEKQVLETESNVAPDILSRLLAARFGARGYGLSKYRELALRSARPEDVAAWTSQRFTRGNAAMWWSGSVPDDLALDLPDGPRHPPPRPVPLPGLVPPLAYAEGTGVVAAGFVLDRDFATTVGFGLLTERLHERLRIERGVSYGAQGGYYPLTGSEAHCLLVADCLDEHAATVAHEFVAAVGALAHEGPTADELARAKELSARSLLDAAEIAPRLDSIAADELMGATPSMPDELEEELQALEPEAVRMRMDEARREMLLVVPEGVAPPPGLSSWRRPAQQPIAGRAFRTAGLAGLRGPRLIVGEAGLSLADQDGEPITIAFEDCVLVTRARDGELMIVGVDEASITVRPHLLKDGAEALAAIEAALPPWMFVPEEEGTAGVVEEMVREKLGRRWMVSGEIEELPELLHPGERLLNLAEASRGMKTGLLALTDRRLLFRCKGGLGKDVLIEVARSDVLRAWGSNASVSVQRHDLGAEAFDSVTPRERAGEFVAALAGGAAPLAGAPPPPPPPPPPGAAG